MRTLPSLLLALVLAPAPVVAQPRAEAGAAHLSYTAHAMGMRMLNVDAALALEPSSYRVDVAYETAGLLSTFLRGQQYSSTQGLWRASRPAPQRFLSQGRMRGQERQTVIDYEGGQPQVRALVPPNQGEREEVPVPARRDTVDTLSALAFLVRQVAETGRCEGASRIYDGRRLTEITARTVGYEVISREGDSLFEGTALRCDFNGRQLAGFMVEGDQSWSRQPHGGSAWLARVVPGAPPVPVRLTFATRWFGEAVMRLTAAGPGMGRLAPPVAGR